MGLKEAWEHQFVQWHDFVEDKEVVSEMYLHISYIVLFQIYLITIMISTSMLA